MSSHTKSRIASLKKYLPFITYVTIGILVVIGIILFTKFEYSTFAKNFVGLDNYLQASITTVALVVSVSSVTVTEIVKNMEQISKESQKMTIEHAEDVLDQLQAFADRTHTRVPPDHPELLKAQDSITEHNEFVAKIRKYVRDVRVLMFLLIASAGLCILVDIWMFIFPISQIGLILSFTFMFGTAFFFAELIREFFGNSIDRLNALEMSPLRLNHLR